MTLFDMSGKVVVITTSTRGIGHAIAERMATIRLWPMQSSAWSGKSFRDATSLA
jgi:NADP-dependent 3-hydroxy acid dehydrogenase YdfG